MLAGTTALFPGFTPQSSSKTLSEGNPHCRIMEAASMCPPGARRDGGLQKLQLRNIAPKTQFVHSTPIYITQLCAKMIAIALFILFIYSIILSSILLIFI